MWDRIILMYMYSIYFYYKNKNLEIKNSKDNI